MKKKVMFDGLCRYLKENAPTLSDLTLCDQDLGEAETQVLADILASNTVLKWLNLGYNPRIGDGGVTALANMLRKNKALEDLWLNNTGCGEQGATAVADALCTNTTLKMLVVGNSARIGDGGVTVLAGMLRKNNKALEVLSLYNTGCGEQGATAVADALCTNTTLVTLYIQGNDIGPAGVRALAASLCTNIAITNLDWDRGKDAAADEEIKACVQRNNELGWLPLRHYLFPPTCQRVLWAVMLGMRRLKARVLTETEGGHADALLVHVDPACIEQALEGMRRNDKWPNRARA